jgi:hypothetical protein
VGKPHAEMTPKRGAGRAVEILQRVHHDSQPPGRLGQDRILGVKRGDAEQLRPVESESIRLVIISKPEIQKYDFGIPGVSDVFRQQVVIGGPIGNFLKQFVFVVAEADAQAVRPVAQVRQVG